MIISNKETEICRISTSEFFRIIDQYTDDGMGVARWGKASWLLCLGTRSDHEANSFITLGDTSIKAPIFKWWSCAKSLAIKA